MVDSTGQPAGATTDIHLSKREQVIEAAIFLSLLLPSLVLSFFSSDWASSDFVLTTVATILRDLSLLSLILFFLWRSKEPIGRIGWTVRHVWRDIVLGVVLFVPMFISATWLGVFLSALGFSFPSRPLSSLIPDSSALQMMLALVLVIVVALVEETIFRGYLMLRFKAITGSEFWSLLPVTLVFALVHGYQGAAGAITIGAIGLVLGLVYIWRKSLVAPIIMHFLQDLVTIVLIPLLMRR